MLHQTFPGENGSHPGSSGPAPTASVLVAHALAALDDDLVAVRSYLGQLEGLLARTGGEASVEGRVHEPSAASQSTRGGLAAWQIKRIERHIADHLSRNISLEDLSEIARLSHGHLCRSFKISMGDSPHRFIMRKRVEKACEMLLATSDSLSQIACDCGLSDQAHLTRLFRKFVGDTPMAWRRTWLKEAV